MLRKTKSFVRTVDNLLTGHKGSQNYSRPLGSVQDKLSEGSDIRHLSYEELKPKTQTPRQNTFLIDVREPTEVRLGKIPSAVNLPLSILPESLHLGREAFMAKHGFEKPHVDQEIIFYCRSGARSTKATDVAKRSGYRNIYNYKGSWLDWVYKET